jgi:hypothetical protein
MNECIYFCMRRWEGCECSRTGYENAPSFILYINIELEKGELVGEILMLIEIGPRS